MTDANVNTSQSSNGVGSLQSQPKELVRICAKCGREFKVVYWKAARKSCDECQKTAGTRGQKVAVLFTHPYTQEPQRIYLTPWQIKLATLMASISLSDEDIAKQMNTNVRVIKKYQNKKDFQLYVTSLIFKYQENTLRAADLALQEVLREKEKKSNRDILDVIRLVYDRFFRYAEGEKSKQPASDVKELLNSIPKDFKDKYGG